MTREELAKLLQETDERQQKAKSKRNWSVIFGYTVFYTLLFFKLFGDNSAYALLAYAFVGFIISFFQHWINLTIYSHLVNAGQAEASYMEQLEKQWRDMQ